MAKPSTLHYSYKYIMQAPSPNNLLHTPQTEIHEPCHDKMYLREFPTRLDINRPAHRSVCKLLNGFTESSRMSWLQSTIIYKVHSSENG